MARGADSDSQMEGIIMASAEPKNFFDLGGIIHPETVELTMLEQKWGIDPPGVGAYVNG
jgi:hypothetical protein